MPEENTEIIVSKEDNSNIFGVSLRGWICLMLCGTVALGFIIRVLGCLWYSISYQDFDILPLNTKVDEPLYTMAVAALSFYLGQKHVKK